MQPGGAQSAAGCIRARIKALQKTHVVGAGLVDEVLEGVQGQVAVAVVAPVARGVARVFWRALFIFFLFLNGLENLGALTWSARQQVGSSHAAFPPTW